MSQSALRELSRRAGILEGYEAAGGAGWQHTSDDARRGILHAMGIPASNDEEAGASLAALEAREREQLLAPTRVLQPTVSQPIRLAGDLRGVSRVEVLGRIRTDSGATIPFAGEASITPERELAGLDFPPMPPGIHELDLRLRTGGRELTGKQHLIVAPARCVAPAELCGERLFGIWTNLYSLRSDRGVGAGDLSDLSRLCAWAAGHGAAFVGVNPLHALRNRPPDISPYGPVSRLFENSFYLDLFAVPELESCDGARALLGAADRLGLLRRLRAADRLDHEAITDLQRPVLEALHRSFRAAHHRSDTPRARAYQAFCEERGSLLEDYATFCALCEHRRDEGYPEDFRQWSAELRDPRSEAVRRFREDNRELVDLHQWVQFELNRQIQACQDSARDAGMPIGLYQDLAVGTLSSGFDAWAFEGLFLDTISVGAPPDAYSAQGQDWGLPPLDPRRLRSDGYRYFRRLIAAGLRHGGMLRIDHVLGLARQYWIPAGCSPKDGAYVAFPTHDLFSVLALESRRHGALIVGEDLGTVPPGLREQMAQAGILSSQVFIFERGHHGEFHPAHCYSDRALVTANTHDFPPLCGYADGRDLDIRRAASAIESDDELWRAKDQRGRDMAAIAQRLREDGLLAPSSECPPAEDLIEPVHAFLARTPAPLVGLSLDDLCAEREPVNVPGVPVDRHPSWSRRMGMSLDELMESPQVAARLAPMGDRRSQ